MTSATTPSMADVPELLELEDSLEAIHSFFLTQGWTDGLPFIPPTTSRVKEMYQYLDRGPKDLLGTLPPLNGEATIELIAINAVMAGCRPEYMPILVSAVQAVQAPEFNLNGVNSTTHPCTVAVFVTGPIAREIGMNGGANCFGQGTLANATIGRAMRLILLNIAGATPGEGDKATQGTPAKFSFCGTETEETPWEPFHVYQGMAPEDSAVAVMAIEGPHNIIDGGSTTAIAVMEGVADAMRGGGHNDFGFGRGNPLLVLCPEHAAIVARDGWGRREIQAYLWEKVRKEYVARPSAAKPLEPGSPNAPAPAVSNFGPTQNPGIPTGERWICEQPSDIFVMVAGGSGGQSTWCPSFGLQKSVVRRIEYSDGTPVRQAMTIGGKH